MFCFILLQIKAPSTRSRFSSKSFLTFNSSQTQKHVKCDFNSPFSTKAKSSSPGKSEAILTSSPTVVPVPHLKQAWIQRNERAHYTTSIHFHYTFYVQTHLISFICRLITLFYYSVSSAEAFIGDSKQRSLQLHPHPYCRGTVKRAKKVKSPFLQGHKSDPELGLHRYIQVPIMPATPKLPSHNDYRTRNGMEFHSPDGTGIPACSMHR